MANTRTGYNMTQVDTTAQHPLGLEIEDPRSQDDSNNRFRYVKAGSAISAGNGLIVALADADEPFTLVPCSALNQVIVAVAEVAIASGSFGWVQIKGRHAAVTKSTAVITAGQVLAASATAGALIPVVGDGDSNVNSTKLNAAIGLAGGIGVQAIDSSDSNSTLVEVIIN